MRSLLPWMPLLACSPPSRTLELTLDGEPIALVPVAFSDPLDGRVIARGETDRRGRFGADAPDAAVTLGLDPPVTLVDLPTDAIVDLAGPAGTLAGPASDLVRLQVRIVEPLEGASRYFASIGCGPSVSLAVGVVGALVVPRACRPDETFELLATAQTDEGRLVGAASRRVRPDAERVVIDEWSPELDRIDLEWTDLGAAAQLAVRRAGRTYPVGGVDSDDVTAAIGPSGFARAVEADVRGATVRSVARAGTDAPLVLPDVDPEPVIEGAWDAVAVTFTRLRDPRDELVAVTSFVQLEDAEGSVSGWECVGPPDLERCVMPRWSRFLDRDGALVSLGAAAVAVDAATARALPEPSDHRQPRVRGPVRLADRSTFQWTVWWSETP